MTVDINDLLKPRYKVIADYPNSAFPIGEIITDKYNSWSHANKYPAIFKPLQWWEERKESEMPEYFKVPEQDTHGCDIGDNSVHSVDKEGKWGWNNSDAYIFKYKNGGGILSSYLLPATLEEYETYISNLKQ